MTWAEIKKAIEDAGVEETDEILVIQCGNLSGSKTTHKSRLGRKLKVTEKTADDKQERDARGCAA